MRHTSTYGVSPSPVPRRAVFLGKGRDYSGHDLCIGTNTGMLLKTWETSVNMDYIRTLFPGIIEENKGNR